MLVAIVFALLVISAGYAVLRALRLPDGVTAYGMAPAAGLAIMSALSTVAAFLHVPPPFPGLCVLGCAAAGLGLIVVERESLLERSQWFARNHRLSAALFGAAVLVPVISIGVAFHGVQAPLSPHDGAFHVETSDAIRRGTSLASWYPPGLAALFGATLQLLPWLDSATGVFELGIALTLLAPIAVFGLGSAVSRNLVVGGWAAVLVSLTFLFPYFTQLWGGWPQVIGILLVIGLWTLAGEYVERPRWSVVAPGGLIVGAIVLVHGTELYTSAIVMAVVGLADRRRLRWPQLGVHLVVGSAVALICAAPYVPALLGWAAGGGAFEVGFEGGRPVELDASAVAAAESLGFWLFDALGVDLPVRVVLVACGLFWAFRSRVARRVVVVTGVFVGLAVVSSFLNGLPLVRVVFAATYPWSLPFRLLSFASVTLAIIGGAGCVWIAASWESLLGRVRTAVARRLLGRTARLVVPAWLVLAIWAMTTLLSISAAADSNFTTDDAAAMLWLHQYAESGAVVANDTFADAGIWAPYKAGVPILFYRSISDPVTAAERELVVRDIAKLDSEPAASAAACRLNIRYVYYGAAISHWQQRTFPTLPELRASSGLEEMFNRGGAVVFRLRLNCG